MIVFDAAMMGWIAGGAVGGVALIAVLARQRAHRRQRDEIRMPEGPISALRSVSGPASVSPAVPPASSAAAWRDSQSLPGAAAVISHPPRNADAIRAEIAAHSERLAAARAVRAAKQAAEQSRQAAPAAGLAPARRASADRSEELPRQVFDPTRSTPWQQVVDSMSRSRAGDSLPSSRTGASGQPARVVPISAAAAAAAALNAAASGTGAERSRRVLVADDARVVRVKLQRLLSAQGWEVIEASDGDEALRLLSSHRPDLLITDVAMPGLDGFALTRAVRADSATAALPVIMITAADDEHREEATRAGVTMLLGKPYGEAALLAHMRRLMGLKPATPVVTVAAETVAA